MLGVTRCGGLEARELELVSEEEGGGGGGEEEAEEEEEEEGDVGNDGFCV
jgi:hypothetical protein